MSFPMMADGSITIPPSAKVDPTNPYFLGNRTGMNTTTTYTIPETPSIPHIPTSQLNNNSVMLDEDENHVLDNDDMNTRMDYLQSEHIPSRPQNMKIYKKSIWLCWVVKGHDVIQSPGELDLSVLFPQAFDVTPRCRKIMNVRSIRLNEYTNKSKHTAVVLCDSNPKLNRQSYLSNNQSKVCFCLVPPGVGQGIKIQKEDIIKLGMKSVYEYMDEYDDGLFKKHRVAYRKYLKEHQKSEEPANKYYVNLIKLIRRIGNVDKATKNLHRMGLIDGPKEDAFVLLNPKNDKGLLYPYTSLVTSCPFGNYGFKDMFIPQKSMKCPWKTHQKAKQFVKDVQGLFGNIGIMNFSLNVLGPPLQASELYTQCPCAVNVKLNIDISVTHGTKKH